MQRQITFEIRNAAFDALSRFGPMTLSELERMTGFTKRKLKYAIETTNPFNAIFKKNYKNRILKYEAVPICDVYGEENFY